jgi:hypothetical protein
MNAVDAGGARISGTASRERRRQGAHRPRQCGGAFQIIKRVEARGPAQERPVTDFTKITVSFYSTIRENPRREIRQSEDQ